MHINQTLTWKPGVVAAVLSLLGLTVMIPGWAWWNGKGPFRNQSPTTTVDLLADVKYVHVDMTFDRFVDFRDASRIRMDEQGLPVLPTGGALLGGSGITISPEAVRAPYPEQPRQREGEIVPSLPPFLRDPDTRGNRNSSRTKKERGEMLSARQGLTMTLSNAVRSQGLQLLPFESAKLKSVSENSCATLHTIIRTYKVENGVWFQVETSISGVVRAQFANPAYLSAEFGSDSSWQYVVQEKYAVQAIDRILRESVISAIRRARSNVVRRSDVRRPLDSDPEAGSAANAQP